MKLSEELIRSMLKTLDKHPHNFMMVSDLAGEVKHIEVSGTLTDEFTNHLLHLQDLTCFVNSEGFSTFGYRANIDKTIEKKFSHCFEDKLIRINAHGRELLDVLENDNITDKGKASALRFGGDVVRHLLIKAFSGELVT